MLGNSTITYKISFYSLFSHSLVWVEVPFLVFAPALFYLIDLIRGEDTNWAWAILSITFLMIIGVILCLVFTAIYIKFHSIEISSSGINGTGFISRYSYIKWESILVAKRWPFFPLFKTLVVYNKNQKKTYIPLYLEQLEQFQSETIRLAGDDNQLTKVLKDLRLSNPPRLRVEPSQRSSLKKRLAISIPMAVIFLLFAGCVFVIGMILIREFYDGLGLLEDTLPDYVSENCFFISQWLKFWVVVLWPPLLVTSTLTPPLFVFFSFRKRVIFPAMILGVFTCIAFYIIGYVALFLC